ncbi:MAG TPA: D-alanine--D-alanine ligase family protein [Candidatus Binataceae bacterium]|nr:D-alanine--D-alanine ligase family protein [Candidatus Binataceae bacterium]
MSRIRVGVIFGGRSSEHEISLRSAQTVMSAMDPARYEVVPIGIARDGRWYLYHDAQRMLRAAVANGGELNPADAPVSLLAQPVGNPLVSLNRGSAEPLEAAHGPLDVVFPVLHGSYGEDGTVQGLLELANIPYVGAGVLGSAVGMDKDLQKRLLREAGVPVVRFKSLERNAYSREPEIARRLAGELGYPVFVKPNALGSSIGVTRVKGEDALAAALEDAFQYDRKVLIEASCQGREFECSVLGNEEPQASLPGEVMVEHGHDFYSYDSKYMDPEGASFKIPAELPGDVSRRISDFAVAAFKALSLRGMARVDFLATRDLAQIYVGEVNTIPGFTSISMYPKLWEVSGLPLPRLIDRLIDLALEEHRQRAELKVTYNLKPPS